MAIFGATAELNLAVLEATTESVHWAAMEGYVNGIRKDRIEGCINRAILCVHAGELGAGQNWINDARRILERELTALVNESYIRAYSSMVQLQQLAELEEIIGHKSAPEALPREHLVQVLPLHSEQGRRRVR